MLLTRCGKHILSFPGVDIVSCIEYDRSMGSTASTGKFLGKFHPFIPFFHFWANSPGKKTHRDPTLGVFHARGLPRLAALTAPVVPVVPVVQSGYVHRTLSK